MKDVRIVASEVFPETGRYDLGAWENDGGGWTGMCSRSNACCRCPLFLGDHDCTSVFESKQELALFVSAGGDDVWEADFRDDTDTWVWMRRLA